MIGVREVAEVRLPTAAGEFRAVAFEIPTGEVYLALVKGDVNGGASVLARLHSECLTGDVVGSLRCDCGLQLRIALRTLAAEGRGVLLYLTGQEGRGIGLVNKLRAYQEQDAGADTLDANLRLGLPADLRDYAAAAAVLGALGVTSVRLLSNNPDKAAGLRANGIAVDRLVPLVTVPHLNNRGYLRTKRDRMGHLAPSGFELPATGSVPVDVTALLGTAPVPSSRPYVAVKYAQTLDGRIATSDGDSKWISGEDERRISHAMRAACDAVLVGAGTALCDDPLLTVRLAPGVSPLRVVLDGRLRIPMEAALLGDDAPTLVITTDRAETRGKRSRLIDRGIGVRTVPAGPGGIGVDLGAALALLRQEGVRSVMVEGGAQVITAMLAADVVDRVVASVSARILGAGTEAVGDLHAKRISDAVQLTLGSVHPLGDDVLLCFDRRRD